MHRLMIVYNHSQASWIEDEWVKMRRTDLQGQFLQTGDINCLCNIRVLCQEMDLDECRQETNLTVVTEPVPVL